MILLIINMFIAMLMKIQKGSKKKRKKTEEEEECEEMNDY